jgi:hypothetical protein
MRIALVLTATFLLAMALVPSMASTAEAGKPKPSPILHYTDEVWGDILCSGQVDAADAIPVLRSMLQIFDYPNPDCPVVILGMSVQGFQGTWRWSDVDCSNATDMLDVLAILRAAASLPLSHSDGCPTIGQMYPVAIVGK